MINKIATPILNEKGTIKKFLRNKQDKLQFIDILRVNDNSDVFLFVSSEPKYTDEKGREIHVCEIVKKGKKYVCEISGKFHEWMVEKELVLKED